MAEDGLGPDSLGDDPRIRSLDERLKRAQAAENERTGADKAVANESYNLGNRVLAELLGGMIGGALIGWVLDRLFGTSPALLLTLLFLGIGVAFRNIYRISQRSK
ncbi:AtpZ/AtpI family protein [Sphingomonas sp.]|jgi:ATP synthase protein I|uniref:AtpZ/AtpI family protein n=1 Tax=Sphingomonas sp. TaxID=28214 RepID=UPI002D8035E2|nr:AtpZ/AtpI family protein [Sphingomonas sp.]HEU0044089.1 AtpZ/AtpI family protein [Sphingomonas sp.]